MLSLYSATQKTQDYMYNLHYTFFGRNQSIIFTHYSLRYRFLKYLLGSLLSTFTDKFLIIRISPPLKFLVSFGVKLKASSVNFRDEGNIRFDIVRFLARVQRRRPAAPSYNAFHACFYGAISAR